MKHKKLYIGLSIFVLVLGLLFLFSFTVFAVRDIEVDWKTNKTNITQSDDDIIASADFRIGGSVFFHGKKTYIENIEKENPYIEVLNIETVFPSKFIIHLKERLEVYCFKTQKGYYVCDDKLKVLKILENFDSTEENAILVDGVVVSQNYEVGQVMKVENFANIYQSLYENNRTLAIQQSIIKEIKFSVVKDENISKDMLLASITIFNGMKYNIYNCDYGLLAKTKMFMTVYSQIFDYIDKELILQDGSTVVLTETMLYNSTIEIKNYYDQSVHTDKECYFDIVPN